MQGVCASRSMKRLTRSWALRSAAMAFATLLANTSVFAADSWGSWKPAAAANEPLAAEAVFTVAPPVPDGNHLAATARIAPGHYIYRKSLRAEDATGAAIELGLPEGVIHDDEFFGRTEVYEQPELAFTLKGNASPDATLHWQGCAKSGICYPPQTLHIAMPAVQAAQGATPKAEGMVAPASAAPQGADQAAADRLARMSPFAGAALFLGFGLLLAFTPCSLPMIPIVSTVVVAGAPPRRAMALAAVYTVSMAMVYAVVGVIAGLLGANVQAALQTPWMLSAFAALFLLLAASLFGAFELHLPAALQARLGSSGGNGRARGSVLGAAGLGLLSALLVGPCMTAPLAGALLFIGQRGDPLLGALALFMLGLGMGLPLIAMAGFGAKLLPRPGQWMERVRIAFGYVMLGMAALMLSRFLSGAMALAVWGGWLVAIALGLHGWTSGGELNGRAAGALRTAALLTGLWGIFLLVGAAGGGTSVVAPLSAWSAPAEATKGQHATAAKTVEDVDARISGARALGQWTLIDFYADWCISCQVNERGVFAAHEVKKRLASVQVLRPDVTANDEADKALMRRWGVQGPPTMILVGPDGEERRAQRVVGEISAEQFLAALNAAGLR